MSGSMNSQFAGLSTQNSQFGALSDPQETGNLQGRARSIDFGG